MNELSARSLSYDARPRARMRASVRSLARPPASLVGFANLLGFKLLNRLLNEWVG